MDWSGKILSGNCILPAWPSASITFLFSNVSLSPSTKKSANRIMGMVRYDSCPYNHSADPRPLPIYLPPGVSTDANQWLALQQMKMTRTMSWCVCTNRLRNIQKIPRSLISRFVSLKIASLQKMSFNKYSSFSMNRARWMETDSWRICH